jgi:hypothetical protein
VIVAAVTTAWDAAHAVVATMGDRFALLRLRTGAGRREAGRGAIRNTGGEIAMRQELALRSVPWSSAWTRPYQLSDAEVDQAVKAADLVTLARSAVERDYRGEIEFAHDLEALTCRQAVCAIVACAISIGQTPPRRGLVRRCARDSIPPLRRDILLGPGRQPGSKATDVRKRFPCRGTPSGAGSGACTCSARWPARRPRRPAAMARNTRVALLPGGRVRPGNAAEDRPIGWSEMGGDTEMAGNIAPGICVRNVRRYQAGLSRALVSLLLNSQNYLTISGHFGTRHESHRPDAGIETSLCSH